MILEIKGLHAGVGENEVVKGVDLTIKSGEIHVLMGPNGSGKTTLANVLFGNPKYKVLGGDILVDGKSILGKKPDERAKLGLFMQFQNPVEVEGLGFIHFVRASKETVQGSKIDFKEFMNDIKSYMKELDMGEEFINRPVNVGFSGGEKKKSEVLQMLVLKPSIAVLDEPDSGLDIDALRKVAEAIGKAARSRGMGLLIITHYNRILEYIKPDYVHIMINGTIVSNGGVELAEKLEKEGYEKFVRNSGSK
ncbi:MAG: Fe-S cluster assembly ATPase SufC [Candidatus Micrarchaeia archaeon]